MISESSRTIVHRSRPRYFSIAALLAISVIALQLEPTNPTRAAATDLRHSKIALRFDIEQKKVLGDVTHSLSILREGTTENLFRLRRPDHPKRRCQQISRKIRNPWGKLIVPLPAPAKRETNSSRHPLRRQARQRAVLYPPR
jgi:hypothetical protein